MSRTITGVERHAALQIRLSRLESGLREHVGWLQEINRVLVSGRAAKESDALSEDHTHCQFARWLHAELAAGAEDDAHICEIANAHRELHDSVKGCLNRCRKGEKLSVTAAESMGSSALRFWNAIRALQSRIAVELPPSGAIPPAHAASPLRQSVIPDDGKSVPQ